LQVAKVYVSVYGDKDGIVRAFKGLVEKQKYVRSGIAKRMALRMAPDIRFISDEALERGTEVRQLSMFQFRRLPVLWSFLMSFSRGFCPFTPVGKF
jgi:ribosome-binding factor A